ncbi:hypothetical protein evm_007528 [Chilo suppressalis]|nr:hypothetical protein evm_007528 [Chilo suppressalis]
MKLVYSCFVLVCALWEANGYPYQPYYGNNFDTLSYGSSDNSRGGMVMSRYFNPYYDPRAVGGMAAFMFKQPEQQVQPSNQYYSPDRRRQTPQDETFYPQQNEVYFPQAPEKPIATEATEISEPTVKVDLFPTTARATIVPELAEPEVEEVEEPVQTPKKRVSKKKQVKKPVDDDEEDDDPQPKMPAGAFFPMFFGYGGRSSGGGMPGGATAVANAYSTGRGGVATSHATAYGAPRPDYKPQP